MPVIIGWFELLKVDGKCVRGRSKKGLTGSYRAKYSAVCFRRKNIAGYTMWPHRGKEHGDENESRPHPHFEIMKGSIQVPKQPGLGIE
jgi:hypothetical protein